MPYAGTKRQQSRTYGTPLLNSPNVTIWAGVSSKTKLRPSPFAGSQPGSQQGFPTARLLSLGCGSLVLNQ
jgi:hypothetical protein